MRDRLRDRLGSDDLANFGVEWNEPREITEIRATFQGIVPIEAVHPEYWVSLSSKIRQAGDKVDERDLGILAADAATSVTFTSDEFRYPRQPGGSAFMHISDLVEGK